MSLADADVRGAEAAMQERLRTTPRALEARYDAARAEIVLSLSNGSEFAFSPSRADILKGVEPSDLEPIEISAAGFGLHWPKIDADLYVPALLRGLFGPPSRAPTIVNEQRSRRMRFEIHKDAAGEWRWRLRTQNGNVVADSAEGYGRRADCERGIAIVKACAEAPVVDMSAKIAGATPTA